MTTAERAEALQQLYLRLDELTTADEVETYGDFLISTRPSEGGTQRLDLRP
jgi:hypothetical protein